MTHPEDSCAALKVAVICGGSSAEAAVSRSSAAQVAQALRASFEAVQLIELDAQILPQLLAFGPDVVFPVMHGPVGEDGTLQGFLEILGLPYVGCGVAASACAMNKHVAKQLYRAAGLPVADDVLLRRGVADVAVEAKALAMRFPGGLVVKPVDQGSAIGVAFATGTDEIVRAVTQCFEVSAAALVEERIAGREITAGVLERDVPEALPVIEVRSIGGWYDFEHRYAPGASEHLIPAPISAQAYVQVQAIALAAHVALGCRDLSRSDFVVSEDGRVVILETNTLPGMTPTSLYPDGARAAGISFEQLVRGLVLRAHARRQRENDQ